MRPRRRRRATPSSGRGTIGCLAGLLVLMAQSAFAIVRAVPAAYPTINAALDASSPGDTVLVAPGTYTEAETRGAPPFQITSLAFLVGGVVLVSEAGPSSTTLDLSNAIIVDAGVVVVGAQLSLPVTALSRVLWKRKMA